MGGVLGKTLFAGRYCCVAWGACAAMADSFNQQLQSLVTVLLFCSSLATFFKFSRVTVLDLQFLGSNRS